MYDRLNISYTMESSGLEILCESNSDTKIADKNKYKMIMFFVTKVK